METNFPADEPSPALPPENAPTEPPHESTHGTPDHPEQTGETVRGANATEWVEREAEDSGAAEHAAPAELELGLDDAGTSSEPVDSEAEQEQPVSEDQPSDSGDAPPADELMALAEAAVKSRLSPADEERMGALLKEALLGGRAGVTRAIAALPKAPWIVGVRAVEAIWPDFTAGFRTQLLSGLAKEETDASRRIRLSLARALFKLDVPVAMKVAVGVARELRESETGALTSKQAQVFANVFIGRGKPWLGQLSLAELKPADGDALVHCAVLSVFGLPHPPVTQLGVLKWAKEQGRLAKLDPVALEAVKKGVARWSAKWQGALRREVDELPEEILAVLKPAPDAPAAGGKRGNDANTTEASRERGEPRGEDADDEEEQEDESDADDADEAGREGPGPADDDSADDEDDDDDDEGDPDEDDGEDEDVAPPKPRPVYEPRPQKPAAERPVYTPRGGGGVPKNFNLNETLRQIDSYVQSLRSELNTAQSKLRSKESRHLEKTGPIIPGELSMEELARLNQQLEARNAELQERISDLTQHSEDVAVSTGVLTGQPVEDPAAQLRTLLALKLQDDFADFLALEKESNDLVVQQHYKSLLRHVFEVLQHLEVPLKAE